MHTRESKVFKEAVDKFERIKEPTWLGFYYLRVAVVKCAMEIESLNNLNEKLSTIKNNLYNTDPVRYRDEKIFDQDFEAYENEIEENNKKIKEYEGKIKYADDGLTKLEIRLQHPHIKNIAITYPLLMEELTRTIPLKDIPQKIKDIFPEKKESQEFNSKFYYYLIENAHQVYQAQLVLAIGDEDKQEKFKKDELQRFLNDYPKTYREHLVREKGEKEGLLYDSTHKYLENTKYRAVNPYIIGEENFEKKLKNELKQQAIDSAQAKAEDSFQQQKLKASQEICSQFIKNIKDLIESIDWTDTVSTVWGFGGTKINDVLYPTHVAQVYRHCLDWNQKKGDVFEHFNAIALIGAKAKPKPWSFFGLVKRSDEAQGVYDAIEKMHREMPQMGKVGSRK